MAEANTAEEEIPSITHRKMNKAELLRHNIENAMYFKIPKFFISDILAAKKIENDGCSKQNTLIIRNIKCRNVMIRGLIVRCNNYEDKIIVSVDDGTGILNCFLQPNEELDRYREEIHTHYGELLEQCRDNPENKLLGAALMMQTIARGRAQLFPHFSEFMVGITVQVVGTVKEYKNVKCCFVSHIMKENKVCVSTMNNYLSRIKELYEDPYNQISAKCTK